MKTKKNSLLENLKNNSSCENIIKKKLPKISENNPAKDNLPKLKLMIQ